MAKARLDGVTKIFDEADGSRVVAVDDLSLDIADGEFLVVVGPSGCGKSTFLRMVAGLETVTEGEIRLDDRVINDVPAMYRDIAMVFQSYALYPHMSVRGNMRFGLEESTDMSDDEIDRIVADTAAMMGIEELLDRTPGELSGGQQQRVALGRAIVRDPEVFLLDEPLSNLDAKLRGEMRTELQRLQEELGVTTIYVTHDQTEAMTMGDRIAILNDGRLQQVGTPLECYHRPRNRFVAGFIGEPPMNFVDVSYDAAATELVADAFRYPVADDIATAAVNAQSSKRLVVGIRPEDIDLGAADASTAHTVPVTVTVVEPMGDENIVYLGREESEAVSEVGWELVATVEGMETFEAGETIDAHFPEDALHLFDGETGQALHNRRLDDETTAPSL